MFEVRWMSFSKQKQSEMALPTKSIMQTHDLLNYYLTMNMNNICRICLEKSNKLTPIFDPIKPPHFSVLITACATVQVQEGDGLPPYICQRCISRLNIAFQFKTQCETSDRKLRQCFEIYDLPQAPDFSGFGIKEGHVNNSQDTADTATKEVQTQNKQTQPLKVQKEIHYEEAGGNGQEIIVEHQDEAKKYTEDNISVLQVVETIDVQKQQVNEHELEDSCSKQENHTIKLEDLNITNITNSSSSANRKSKKPPKIHQCNTCGKIFKTKPSLVHHIRIHTGERPYVCHLCLKRFVNGGHLHTHMKTHTGEKNHICAACNKAFATTQQLTKHTIAVHTSERPYGCTYCPRRFASSSNLNTHLKIHTGEKNYHCEVCGKTFSTKGQLLQHMLVHTGEKAFLCEYCNKSFSQKAHLLRHLRTHNRTE